MEKARNSPGSFRLMADGASRGNPGPASYGFVLSAADGQSVAEEGRFIGHATNNVAEYRGLIAGLERATDLGVDDLEVALDSELIVRQINGEYRVKNAGLKPLFARAKALSVAFRRFRMQHVPRRQNREADALANEALDRSADVAGNRDESSKGEPAR